MSARLRFLVLILIMVLACAIVMAVTAGILYRGEVQTRREMLQVTAQSQARLIESIGRHELKVANDLTDDRPDFDPVQEALHPIFEAHERYRGFGKTGEFVLARREGNTIVFLLRHRVDSLETTASVAIDSGLAEPMRRALEGLSGTMIGVDYRGETVLAAYEPVAVLNLGIVAKIDVQEFRAPFVRSVLTAAAVGVLIILAGAMLFFRISNPVIVQLQVQAEDLEREIKERTRLNAQLEAKNQELEQILYIASHDLRSPLVNIDGYSLELELAIKELRAANAQKSAEGPSAVNALLEHDMPEALRFIRTSATKMDTLLNGLLKLSRSGRRALRVASLDMNELITNVIDGCEYQIQAVGAKIEVTELPSCLGDAIGVDQVFSNLLSNALQYLDPNRPGVIRISGQIDAEQCVYCVEDNGIGIASKNRDKIFEIFRRLDPETGEGDGLGLTIIGQVLAGLEGKVWVESEPGEGSRFFVALPAASEEA